MEKESKGQRFLASHVSPEDNEEKVILCLREYTHILGELYQFESLLYEKVSNLPRTMFKHFRAIREGVETCFNTLEGFVSFNVEFIAEKDRILQEQITLT
jgi:hypothetical protein